MRYLLLGLLAISPLTTFAKEFKIEKCFTRKYSRLHLYKNPKQNVAEVKFALYRDSFSSVLYTNISFKTKGANELIEASVGGSCDFIKDINLYFCRLDEDRGSFSVETKGKMAILKVTSLIVPEAITTHSNENENVVIKPGKENGLFRLNKDKEGNCRI